MPKQTPISEYYLFTGTYHSADTEGVFLYKFNTQTGKATFVRALSGIENPSFLTLSPDKSRIYVVSETHHEEDGQVFAYHFDKKNGTFTFINKVPTRGDDPCNITSDPDGSRLFVANYTSGSLAVIPVMTDGSVDVPIQLIQHKGKSIHSPNQDSAHVHCAVIAQDRQHLFVTDLGMDKVFGYIFDEESGSVSPANPAFIDVIPGSGPRLLEFSPDGKFLYLIHELGGQISVFKYENGGLQLVEVISNLPNHYKGRIWSADIHLSPDGNFLYAANRDDLNDIVTYRVNRDNGRLTFLNRQPTDGKTARNFTLTPDGKYVLIGHQNGKEITIFSRNRKTGMLSKTNEVIPVEHAVCLKMIARKTED